MQMTGCSSVRSIPVGDQLAASKPEIVRESGVRICGYVTSDSVRHDFSGTVKLEHEEFLFQPSHGEQPSFRLPCAEVVSFDERDYQPGRTIVLLVSLALLIWGLDQTDLEN